MSPGSLERQFVRTRRRLRPLRASHVDDLGAGKARQHRLHQRIGAHAVFQLGLARLAPARATSARPARAETTTIQRRPVQSASFFDSSPASDLRRARLERDFERPSSKRTSRTSRSSAALQRRGRASRRRARPDPRSSRARAPAQRSRRRARIARAARRWRRARRRAHARGPPRGMSARGIPDAPASRARRAGDVAAADAAPAPLPREQLRRASGSLRPASADRRRRRCAPAPSRRRRAAGRRPATSAMPLSSICQVRARTRIDSFAAKSRPRVRSASVSETSSASAGTIFTPRDEMGELGEIAEHHRRIGAGVVLLAQFAERARHVGAHHRLEQIDDAGAVGKPEHAAARPRRAPARPHVRSPGRAATASRAPSLRRRARSAPAPRARLRSLPCRRCLADAATSSAASTRRRSKRWQRDSTVIGTLRISVVAKMNLACGGGSSSVFSSALKAAPDSMCTSSRM